ncbi:MAG: hypothetical protein KKE02_21690 [Alphaproteobacteria bacterium]|nr:hypothetical protein [Alphaproteobacteria bacterium]MBU1515956.1 hypothetical protein [Alphaproteobacteria bacterium]MBU2092829.1 hypothetical protein [Alphaproteobacteria bacterium]MBU2153646.1 hypothetical protein [Alphaproteobacteria bacterium]MBU2308274.1 hypothetical protein [Alphaproteobacteria bacterium]
MNRLAWIVVLAGLVAGLASPALAQGNAPPQVAAKIAQLDQACQRAGGRPVAKPYVLVHDFTGDARPDFLISEGDYACAGRPGIFQTNNQAFIEIYVTDARNNAQRVYRQQVRAYRVLNTTPRTVQIALTAPACANGQAMCGLTLAFNPQTGGFTAEPVGPAQATAPATPPAPVATGARETEAQFMVRCQREMIAKNPQARKWAADSCKEGWGMAAAAGPLADALIAVATARTAGPLSLAQIKAATPGVRWSAKPGPGGNGVGALGKFDAAIDMKAGSISFGWSAIGEPPPYDVAEALRVRGVALTLVACQSFGISEQTRIYRMTAAGQTPAALTVANRAAPSASASSFYSAALDVARPPQTLAAIRAKAPNDDWTAVCESE